MFKYASGLIAAVVLIAIGCSSVQLPGTGGTSTPEVIQRNDHPPIPAGVTCYVCHKEDIPMYAFHAGYGNDCSQCHSTTTWTANEYAHPAWYLDENHRTRCTRCHTAAGMHDYTRYECWGCHHEQTAIVQSHAALGITDITGCIACHEDVGLPMEVPATQ